MPIPVQALVLVGVPALVLWLAAHSKLVSTVGPVVICYGVGIALANQPWVVLHAGAATKEAQVAVALAIPLLVFSVDFPAWLRLAKSTTVSFLVCVISVMLVAAAGSRIFGGMVPESHKIGGMLVGVYTGGTANMAAIATALGVEPETFMVVNACDIFVTGIYLLFLVTLAGRVWGLFLPAFPRRVGEGATEGADLGPRMPPLRTIVLGGGLSLAIVILSDRLGRLAGEGQRDSLTILAITTLALAASFVRPIRRLGGTQAMGEFFLLIFCVAMGSLARLDRVLGASTGILLFTTWAVVASVLLHLVVAALLRLDRDTVIITSTAAIFGPAFIGPVALALGNREIIFSGITTGLVGYAVGTYLGLAVAWVMS
ncbi:MAG: DUF819 family protein [Nitrospirae bacterium]|nr:DUF819 family protein [Nitrospirota bacterium]